MRWLGIDIGTSGTKALLIEQIGGGVGGGVMGGVRVLGDAVSPHAISNPAAGYSEQDPQDWWRAVCASVRRVVEVSGVEPGSIGGVSFSGQMHGAVLLDGRSRDAGVVRPAILWNDQRSFAECAEIERAVGGRRALVEMTGNAALAGFTLPKLLWVRRHEPGVWSRVRLVLLPKDYIALRMAGVCATDVGDAAGTLLFDPVRRCWHDGVMSAVGVDAGILPDVHESCVVVGRVLEEAARETGLCAGTPVVIGTGDNMAAAVGAGVVRPGMAAASIGTSGVIVSHTDSPRADLPDESCGVPAGRTHLMAAADGTGGGTSGGVGKAGHWCVTGCTLSAGGALSWARSAVFGGASWEELMAEAEGVPAGCEGLVFMPYLTGERCPHPDPDARAGWVGLTSRHTRGHMVRSVIEGVCATMAEIVEIMRSQGIGFGSLRGSGGALEHGLWRRTLADATGLAIEVPRGAGAEHGAAFGAALLAGVGVGSAGVGSGGWVGVVEACRDSEVGGGGGVDVGGGVGVEGGEGGGECVD